ncbi:MAG: sigma-70 family RNA polymerase sigma factor [Actinobacteria bacterium]|nr:sigma-70 family RNA polymerase sigma factor [Actinomycetota bacterium]
MTSSGERRNYREADEDALLSWARSGDERAFAALAQVNSKVVRAVCFRIVGDNQLTDDAMQNTLLAAWRNLARFEGRSKFSTWLCQIAHNASLALVKGRRADPVGNIPEPNDRWVPETADTVAEVHAVRWALGKLPPDFRAALVLREYGGLTYQEIAAAQRIPIDTVKSRIARARQGLAVLLGPSWAGGSSPFALP